eukprot:15654783-Heterocapsa_arctica.AAC.1
MEVDLRISLKTQETDNNGEELRRSRSLTIYTMKVEVHGYGMEVQIFDGGRCEHAQTMVTVLYSKWENQHTHCDLFYPHVE